MANKEVTGGVGSFALFGEETTEGTEATTIDQHFGYLQTISYSITRNIQPQRGMSGDVQGRLAQCFTDAQTEYEVTTEFNVIDFAFMKYVLGAETGAGTGASPFSRTVAIDPGTISISANIDNDTTDRNLTFLGCKADQATLNFASGEVISASVTWKATGSVKTGTLDSTQSLSTDCVYNFSGVDFEIPNGTAVENIVDSATLTFTNNLEPQYGTSVEPTRNIAKAFDTELSLGLKYLDENFLEAIMGGTTTLQDKQTSYATAEVRFEDSATRNAQFLFSELYQDPYSTNDALNEVITEDITLKAKDCTVTEQTTA